MSKPLQSIVDEPTAVRLALREYLSQYLRWKRPNSAPRPIPIRAWPAEQVDEVWYPMIVFEENAGTFDASSFTPNIIQNTSWQEGNDTFVLFKDAEYTEQFDIVIKGTDRIQVASISSAMRPMLSPHSDRYGSLLLDLGDWWFDRKARFTPLSLQHGTAPGEGEDRNERVRAARITVECSVATCKILSVAANTTVVYPIDVS